VNLMRSRILFYIQYKNLCRDYKLPIKALNAFTRALKQCLNVETCQRKVNGRMTNCYLGIRFKDKELRFLKQKKGPLDGLTYLLLGKV